MINTFETLRKNEISNGLSDSEINEIAKLFHPMHVNKGEIVFKEGDKSDDLYIISKGRVGVLILSSSTPGENVKIASLKDGDIFGEFSMIDRSVRSATVVAEEDCDLIFASNLDFNRFLSRNEHVGFVMMKNIAKILTSKLRKMNFSIRDFLVR